MKVHELISILQQMDQELPVWYATDIYDGWYQLIPQGIRVTDVEGNDICLIGEAP